MILLLAVAAAAAVVAALLPVVAVCTAAVMQHAHTEVQIDDYFTHAARATAVF
jgi:hypothetical protein